MPLASKGEESSALSITRNAAGEIGVLLRYRYADRKIHFTYGIAHLRDGRLYFTDKDGFNYVIGFGDNADYGAFLDVTDYPNTEVDYGGYLRVSQK